MAKKKYYDGMSMFSEKEGNAARCPKEPMMKKYDNAKSDYSMNKSYDDSVKGIDKAMDYDTKISNK